MKTQEELLYLEADRYLQELAQRKNSHDIDKTISSNEMRDAIWGLFKQSCKKEVFINATLMKKNKNNLFVIVLNGAKLQP